MATEIELLREDIPRLEKKFGRDNPFVQLLKVQLAFLQNQSIPGSLREVQRPGFMEVLKTKIRALIKL